MKLFLDIGPLQEQNYTGVPAVSEQLARAFLDEWETEVVFFWEDFIIPIEAVCSVLDMRNGSYFLEIVRNVPHNLISLSSVANPEDIVFFTNTGRAERLTSRQCQFVHDLTTVLLPETHHPDTIARHTRDFVNAKLNIDLFFCNSECTKEDLSLYLDIPESRIKVCLLGANRPAYAPEVTISGRYFCILGTFEPRKNTILIFEMLSRHPEWLDEYRFVFVGRFGWGPELTSILQRYHVVNNAVRNGRILFTGFVSDDEKWTLLRNAVCSIYGSLYEGFGLPVLESLSCYTPVVASFSSSLPEVGGDLVEYFDPFDSQSLDQALRRCILRYKNGVDHTVYDVHLARFSWKTFANQIKSDLRRFIFS